MARLAGRMPAFVDLALVSQLCKYVPPGGGRGGRCRKPVARPSRGRCNTWSTGALPTFLASEDSQGLR